MGVETTTVYRCDVCGTEMPAEGWDRIGWTVWRSRSIVRMPDWPDEEDRVTCGPHTRAVHVALRSERLPETKAG